jgi:hypothetical protein
VVALIYIPTTSIHNTQVRNQPRCPPTDKWIRENVVYVHNGDYPAIKNSEIITFEFKRMELEIIMFRKISWTYTAKFHVFSHAECQRSQCKRKGTSRK